MSLYVPDGIAPIVSGAMVRVERRLPQAGQVLVRVGSRVEAEDVVARASIPGELRIVHVARTLAIPPGRVERAMRREIGNQVRAGEPLARPTLSGRVCVAPCDGTILHIDREIGTVTIAPEPATIELQALVRGIVMEQIGSFGVVLETPAAQVTGMYGIGPERHGVLRLLVTDPTEIVTPDRIDARSAFAILIGGSAVTAAALRRAVEEQVRGVIVGSIDERELRAFLGWSQVNGWRHTGTPSGQEATPGLTLMVTEGFGSRPMCRPVFDLLASHDRQEALLEGATQLRAPLRRPRLVIPLSRSAGIQLQPVRPALRVGASVRLLSTTHLGAIAQVTAIPLSPRRLPSGARGLAVEVALESGEALMVPRATVEVLA